MSGGGRRRQQNIVTKDAPKAAISSSNVDVYTYIVLFCVHHTTPAAGGVLDLRARAPRRNTELPVLPAVCSPHLMPPQIRPLVRWPPGPVRLGSSVSASRLGGQEVAEDAAGSHGAAAGSTALTPVTGRAADAAEQQGTVWRKSARKQGQMSLQTTLQVSPPLVQGATPAISEGHAQPPGSSQQLNASPTTVEDTRQGSAQGLRKRSHMAVLLPALREGMEQAEDAADETPVEAQALDEGFLPQAASGSMTRKKTRKGPVEELGVTKPRLLFPGEAHSVPPHPQ